MGRTASIKSEFKRELGRALGGAVFGAGGYLGVQILRAIYKTFLENKQQQAFSQMHQIFPELNQLDPKRKRMLFETIRTFNPELAANPWTLGSLISRIHAAQYITPDLLAEMTKVKVPPPPQVALGRYTFG